MEPLTITNHGPLITASNYWQSEMAQRGLLYLSTNAGCFRLLIPDVHVGLIPDIRQGAKSVIVSMLRPEKWQPNAYCVEFMVEDRSASPWACHLSPGQVDRAPLPEDVTRQWIASVWDGQRGRPHKCLERPAHFRFVTELPWLKPWEEDHN
jgi:hypothetical protein